MIKRKKKNNNNNFPVSATIGRQTMQLIFEYLLHSYILLMIHRKYTFWEVLIWVSLTKQTKNKIKDFD